MNWKFVGVASSVMSTFNLFVVYNIVRVIQSDFGTSEICNGDDCKTKVLSCKIAIMFHLIQFLISVGYLSGFINFDAIAYLKRSLGIIASQGPSRGEGRYRPLIGGSTDELFELRQQRVPAEQLKARNSRPTQH